MIKLQALSSRALSNALSVSAKCISKNTSLAILDHVLLSKKDDGLVFTTGTTDSQLTIPAPLNIVKGDFRESVALPVSGIVSYISTLPDCVINITINEENNTLVLDYCVGSDDKLKSGKVSLTYLDGKDFPLFPELSGDNITHICLPSDVFTMAIDNARVFSANDELRIVMNALAIDIAQDASECYFVASDGQKLYKHTHVNTDNDNLFLRSGQPTTILINNIFFRALSAFTKCEEVHVETNGQSTRICSDGIEFYCKNTEGRYPNYNSVIPRANPNYITINKKEIINTLKRVSIFGSESSNMIKFQKEGMFLDVSACDMEVSTNANEQVIIMDSSCPEGFAIGVKCATFIDAINAICSDTIKLMFSDPSHPIIIVADEPAPYTLSLAMPMLLN